MAFTNQVSHEPIRNSILTTPKAAGVLNPSFAIKSGIIYLFTVIGTSNSVSFKKRFSIFSINPLKWILI
jgi:hypothetical protein